MNKRKLLSYLKAMGMRPTMENFNDRKKMQKISYLLPLFGLDVGLTINHYNWYWHGPYSPDLARTLFDIIEDPNRVVTDRLTEEEVEKIEKLKIFLGDNIRSVDFLELLVSLHFLLRQAKIYGIKTDEVIEILKEKKPYFKNKEIEQALKKVQMLL